LKFKYWTGTSARKSHRSVHSSNERRTKLFVNRNKIKNEKIICGDIITMRVLCVYHVQQYVTYCVSGSTVHKWSFENLDFVQYSCRWSATRPGNWKPYHKNHIVIAVNKRFRFEMKQRETSKLRWRSALGKHDEFLKTTFKSKHRARYKRLYNKKWKRARACVDSGA
jgi:hypothetical protein